MLRQRCPRGCTRRTVEAVQGVRISTAQRNGVDRPVVEGSSIDRGAVQKSVRALNQSREWFSALGIGVEVVEISESSSRTHFKDNAVAIHAAVDGRAIEIAVAGLHQRGIWPTAVGSIEAMQKCYRARRRDLENCTQVRIGYPGQAESRAIEISIVSQYEWRKGLAAVGSVKVIESFERSPGSNAVDSAAVCRSPIFGSSVVSAIRAFDRRSPWERAIALVERVQECEFPARADFENSPVVRGAVFIRRAVEVSVGAERESAGRECACYSIKVVKYAHLSRRSDLKNCARIVSASVVGSAVEVSIPALNNESRIVGMRRVASVGSEVVKEGDLCPGT